MPELLLGKISEYQQSSRYTIHTTHKALVLFRLSHLNRPKCVQTNTDGVSDYFCMNQECPHAGGPMEDSTIEYDVENDSWIASCPWHSYDFNVETGESPHGVRACTYPVKVNLSQGVISLEIPQHEGQDVRLIGVEAVSEIFVMKEMVQSLPQTDELLPHVYKPKSSESTNSEQTLAQSCSEILLTADPERKIELTHNLYSRLTPNVKVGQCRPPDVPPRKSLKIVDPSKMLKLGRAGNVKSRIAILHSLANIEQWAIDLALDICARFSTFETDTGKSLPRQFFEDWLKVANDEAKHFSLLRNRLEELGSYFGELPVHHGLWDSASITAHDLRARISIIALVHEARGLDVNPQTIAKFHKAGDAESVRILQIIHNDEITHVTTGHRWLSWICQEEGTEPVDVFRANVKRYFMGAVKGPFNTADREKAGLQTGFYEDLDGRPKRVLLTGG